MKKIECWIDGACEPKNPGGTASWGVYIVEEGASTEHWGIVGSGDEMSNNVAEYAALTEALKLVKKHFGTEVELSIYGDSQLVIQQMNRKWKIHGGLYFDHAQCALHLLLEFPIVKLHWIPRERNTFADALSKRALAEKGIKPHYSRR
jgi:ribonuclease HI